MLEHIEAILRDKCGLDKVHPILAGVSGGPDSLCLLGVLHEAGIPVVAAHFNHRLRPGAEAEGLHVQETAARLGIESVLGGGDVRAYAKDHAMSIEEAARHLRYNFLFEQARRIEAQAVAVGHTADDQVETVLMHFLRGAGLSGLKGMSARTLLPLFDDHLPLVRPLLDTWREETLAYCTDHGLQPVHDPSNDSLEFTRNRLRNALIPVLESYNPRFRRAVWRSVQSLEADHALLSEMIDTAWETCVASREERVITFYLSKLRACPPALQRSLIRLAIETLRPGQETGYLLLNMAADFINESDAPQADLTGGLRLFREGSALHMAAGESDLPRGEWPQMPAEGGPISLTVPGVIELPGGWTLACEERSWPDSSLAETEKNQDPFQAWLDVSELDGDLILRSRKEGDRFEPLGMEGHSQKLSDFMVNEKMPRRLRDRWPLLCLNDKVIWVPGYRPAHSSRVKPGSRKILHLAFSPPPGRTPPD